MIESHETTLETRKNLIDRLDTEGCADTIQGLAMVLRDFEPQDMEMNAQFNGLANAFAVFAERARDAHYEDRRKDRIEHEKQLERFMPVVVLKTVADRDDRYPTGLPDLASELELPVEFLRPIVDSMLKEKALLHTSWGYELPEHVAMAHAAAARRASHSKGAGRRQ